LDVHAYKVIQPDKVIKILFTILLTIDIIIYTFQQQLLDDRTRFISAFGPVEVLATLWQRTADALGSAEAVFKTAQLAALMGGFDLIETSKTNLF
jgi:hypothetical protein